MPRNLLIDIAALSGAEPTNIAVVNKRRERPGAPDRDVHGPDKFLHIEAGDAPGNSDFGRSHRHSFEFLQEMPDAMKARNGSPLFEFEGLPVLESPPQSQGQRRNFFFDVNELAGGNLLAAVLVPNRVMGPPTSGFFVHCLFADDDALPDDLDDPGARAHEFLTKAPPWHRRADGGPLHVFLGQPLYETKPVVDDSPLP